jgi:hypothetical protein
MQLLSDGFVKHRQAISIKVACLSLWCDSRSQTFDLYNMHIYIRFGIARFTKRNILVILALNKLTVVPEDGVATANGLS